MKYTKQTTKDSEYRAFNPADYPAYSFPETGPVRIVPVPRGPWAGKVDFPIASFVRKKDGRLCVNLTRADGERRTISVDTIEKAMGRDANVRGPLEQEDPWNDSGTFPRRSIDGFPDYVMDALGAVYRWRSEGRGSYARPKLIMRSGESGRSKVGFPRYFYHRLQDAEGVWRNLDIEKLLDRTGFTKTDMANALSLKENVERELRGFKD